jgi:hypothetical protein
MEFLAIPGMPDALAPALPATVPRQLEVAGNDTPLEPTEQRFISPIQRDIMPDTISLEPPVIPLLPQQITASDWAIGDPANLPVSGHWLNKYRDDKLQEIGTMAESSGPRSPGFDLGAFHCRSDEFWTDKLQMMGTTAQLDDACN